MNAKIVELGLGGGSLLQTANRSLTQSMSYTVDTSDGKTIMIDGGCYCVEDAENLYRLLCQRNKKVDAWFITHAHWDHLGALLYLMEKNDFDIEIENIVFNFPDEEWLKNIEQNEWEYNSKFLDKIQELGINIISPEIGDVLKFGNVSVEILSVPVEYKNYNAINPTSMIFKLYFPKRDILFLADFDIEGQEHFFKYCDASKLRCDVVQMAHHGQNGVDKSFYKKIMPKICLYTAPQWLWENNHYKCTNPETVGKGPFTTLETRKWMEELGAEQSYGHFGGDYVFV